MFVKLQYNIVGGDVITFMHSRAITLSNCAECFFLLLMFDQVEWAHRWLCPSAVMNTTTDTSDSWETWDRSPFL